MVTQAGKSNNMKKPFIYLLFFSLILLADNKYYKYRFIELQESIPKTKIEINKLEKSLKKLKKSKLSLQNKLVEDKENLSLRDLLVRNIFKQEELIEKKNSLEKKAIIIEKELELLKKILNTNIFQNSNTIPTSSALQDDNYLTFDFDEITLKRNFQKQLEDKIFNYNLQNKTSEIKNFIWTFQVKEITVNKNKIQFVPFITIK